MVELVKWFFSDHRRCAWLFAFVTVFLSASIIVTALLAPHIGALGVLGGVGAGASGSAAVEVARRRRQRKRDYSDRM